MDPLSANYMLDEADRSPDGRLDLDYDVYVRRIGSRSKTPPKRLTRLDRNQAFWDPRLREAPVYLPTRRKDVPVWGQPRPHWGLTYAQLKELIKRVSEKLDMLEAKERNMDPRGKLYFNPISRYERKSIADLVFQCNDALGEVRDARVIEHFHYPVDEEMERSLKNSLIETRSKLLYHLHPQDREYFDREDRHKLDERMRNVEDRIKSIVDGLDMEEDRQRRLELEEKIRKEAEELEERLKKQELEKELERLRLLQAETQKARELQEEMKRVAELEEEIRKRKILEDELRKIRELEEEHRRKAITEEELRRRLLLDEEHRRRAALLEEDQRRKFTIEEELRKIRELDDDFRRRYQIEEELKRVREVEIERKKRRALEEELEEIMLGVTRSRQVSVKSIEKTLKKQNAVIEVESPEDQAAATETVSPQVETSSFSPKRSGGSTIKQEIFLEKVRLLERLVREAKKEDRERISLEDNRRLRAVVFEALDTLDEVKAEMPPGVEGIEGVLESFVNHEASMKKIIRKLDQEEKAYKEEKEEREKREERERREAKEEREKREILEKRILEERKKSIEVREAWENKILTELRELKKAEEERKLPQHVRIQPRMSERETSVDAIKIIQSSPHKNQPTQKPKASSEDRPGEHIQTVVLGQCAGAITVIKTIGEEVLAVGFSSGEVAYYSLADFQFLHKFKEHTGSITSMENGQISMEEEGVIKSTPVLYTGGNEKDMTVVIWDLSTYQPLRRLRGHDHMITGIADLHDDATIVTCSMDAKIAFWDLRETEPICIQLIEDMKFPIIVMEFDCEDGILSVGTLDGQLGLWQVYLENGEYIGVALLKLLNLECHVLDILRTGSLPNSILTLESDFCVREYDTFTGRLLRVIKGDRPLVDVFLIDAPAGRGLTMFTLDNSHNLQRLKNYTDLDPRVVLPRTPDGDGHVKRYIGYNPKSQIYISADELLLLAPDQGKQTISVTRLNLN